MVDFLKQQLVSITHLDNDLFIDTVGVPKSTLVMFVKIWRFLRCLDLLVLL